MNRSKLLKLCFLTTPLLFISNSASSGGFQIFEQNGSLGDVHAGYAVDAQNASIGFYNAAGLTHIENPQFVSSNIIVNNQVQFTGNTAIEVYTGLNTGKMNPPIHHSGETESRGTHIIPAIHYARPINSEWTYGFSITAPFAAELDWSEQDFTRYNTTHNGIKTINISPSFARKLSPILSMGFGPDLQYLELEADKIVGTNIPYSDGMGHADHAPEESDSRAFNRLTNLAAGWHLGFLWEPHTSLQFGLQYRSAIHHHAHGISKMIGRLAGDMSNPYDSHKINVSKNLQANVEIPATTALSFGFKPHPQWALFSTLLYTQWHIVRSLDLKNVPSSFNHYETQTPLFLDRVQNPLYFKDTWTVLLGTQYQLHPQWMMKLGLGFDQTPTHPQYRDLKIPDGNRTLYGAGIQFLPTRHLMVEFGFMFVNVHPTKIQNVSLIPAYPAADPNEGTSNPGEQTWIDGKAKAHAYVIGLQFSMNTAEMKRYWGEYKPF